MEYVFFFFFQAEDGIRDLYVTGVQTCALPIFLDLRELRLDRGEACARPREAALHRTPDQKIQKHDRKKSTERRGHAALARAERLPARAPGLDPGEIHGFPCGGGAGARKRNRASPPERCTSTSSDCARSARARDSASASDAAKRRFKARSPYSTLCTRTRGSRSIAGAARARSESMSPGAATPLRALRSSRPRRICSAGSRIARVSGKLFMSSARISSSAAPAARARRAHSTASKTSVAASHAASSAAAGT